MNKFVKMLGIFLLSIALFIGCKNNDDNSYQSITLSDGNWTMVTEFELPTLSRIVITLKATITNGNYVFTSGTTTTVYTKANFPGMDFSEMTDEEIQNEIEFLNMLSFDTYSYDSENEEILITNTFTNEELEEMKGNYDFSKIPSSAHITSNDDKTEYIITETENGETRTITITKDSE
ncbi:hypothetical protein [Treponema bryantii]|uniref:hypothetical protein n=1 Tax=Treponema bryantii TaxID=163 RepID=UPI002B2E29EF|nr:hypothetical protein TRBR_08100 [Treponema bryantii]